MEKKINIEVLGPGCKNCEDLYTNVLAAVEHAGIGDTVKVSKVKDIDTFIKMGVFSTPALVINGTVASTSRVLSPDQVIESLKNLGLC